ncbi:MAG: slipin family protein [Spirochaetaceae bacterium]|nr:MAG: slipin family protein [Spirochaetaceae bacterium]
MKQHTDTQSSGARIKALSHRMRRFRFTGNFSMTTLSALVLVLFAVLAVTLQLAIGLPPSPEAIAIIIGVLAANGIIIAIVPLWSVVLLMTVTFWAVTGYLVPENMLPALLVGAAGLLVAPAIQIVQQWDRAVVFRLGKFKRVLEPGPHVILPVLDSVIGHVDMRIRVTDFSAERSVTSDTVPVHVDALAFWMVWDAEKALLEVEDYFAAVTLSAQTVLRDTIGRNELATLLSDRETLGAQIQETLDRKTSPWGITILSIEFTEILLPKELEDALSRRAQAERERQARVILSSAEEEIAERFAKAGATYEKNPKAFELRAMNLVFDGMKQNKNMILVPTHAVESIGGALGLAAKRANDVDGTPTADTRSTTPEEHS